MLECRTQWENEKTHKTNIQGAEEKQRDRKSRRLGGHLPKGCLGDIRLSPALNDSDGVTGLHPQSTWLCDLPHTAPLRKPSLWRQKKGWLSFWPKS